MQRLFKIVTSFVILILLGNNAFSQTYSVTLNTQLIPPYSVYLSDYVSPESEKLFVSMLLNDANLPTYNVKLKLTIEGVGIKIESKTDAYFPPITLTSGMMERLSSTDLAPYFDPNNLIFQGITKEQYQKNAALPEGLYKFSVQAFDYNRNVVVSGKSFSQAWIVLNDPPRIVSPICKSTAKVIYPQNLIFQWLPMHLGSPNASFNTEYYFKLVQILPLGRNPNDAMLSSPPIFDATTDNAILYYGISEPQLIPGQQYAWRVQARDKGGKDMFKNNGYSEVCMFTYGDPCKPPVNIKAEVQSAQKVKVTWDQMFGPSGYKVRYRQHGVNSQWYEEEVYQNTATINGLAANKKYEYQVQSLCDPTESDYSAIDTFSTKANFDNKNCGIPTTQNQIDKTIQLEALYAGDILMVKGFSVRVSEASGSKGMFSGKGVAYIPFISTYVFTTFNNIKVNSKYEVYEGKILSVRDNLEKYRSKVVTPGLKNDICQNLPDNNSNNANKNNSSSNNGKGNTNNDKDIKDTDRVIIINGNVLVKEGDTIKVNGKEVIVNKDTKIKPGDVVVVNGETIKVNTSESTTKGALNAKLELPLIKIIKKMIDKDKGLYSKEIAKAEIDINNMESSRSSLKNSRKVNFGSGTSGQGSIQIYQSPKSEDFVPIDIKKLEANEELKSYLKNMLEVAKIKQKTDSIDIRLNVLVGLLQKQNLDKFTDEVNEKLKKDSPTLYNDFMQGKEKEEIETIVISLVELKISKEFKKDEE